MIPSCPVDLVSSTLVRRFRWAHHRGDVGGVVVWVRTGKGRTNGHAFGSRTVVSLGTLVEGKSYYVTPSPESSCPGLGVVSRQVTPNDDRCPTPTSYLLLVLLRRSHSPKTTLGDCLTDDFRPVAWSGGNLPPPTSWTNLHLPPSPPREILLKRHKNCFDPRTPTQVPVPR